MKVVIVINTENTDPIWENHIEQFLEYCENNLEKHLKFFGYYYEHQEVINIINGYEPVDTDPEINELIRENVPEILINNYYPEKILIDDNQLGNSTRLISQLTTYSEVSTGVGECMYDILNDFLISENLEDDIDYINIDYMYVDLDYQARIPSTYNAIHPNYYIENGIVLEKNKL